MKKKIKNLRTGAVTRGLSLASLGLRAGAKAAGHAVGNLFSGEAAQALRKKTHLLEQVALLAKDLGELKGSLMKAGQMLSVYGEHFLPPEANQVLKSLQSDSSPVEWKEMQRVLQRQLGADALAGLEIDTEALGAASLGQVHRARVKRGGAEIVLKIQYPGVDRAIDGDLQALRRLLSFTEWLPKIPATDNLFLEVKAMLRQELDYEKELERLTTFRALLAGDYRYVLPEPYPAYSAKRVLAMSYEPGVAVDGPEVRSLSQGRRDALALTALDLYFRELFEWRKVQTDPHFGNYRVRIGKSKDQLVLYDFGAVRELSATFMEKYRQMLAGLFHHDRAAFEVAAERLGVLAPSDPQELKDLFHELCSLVVEPFLEEEPYNWKGSDLPQRVSRLTWDLFRRFPLRAPPREIVFLDRKMAGMFTFLSVLDARIDARAALAPYLK